MLSDTVFERVGDEEMATLPPASHASCERDDDRIRCEGNTGNANYVRMRKLTFEAPDDSSNTSADAESIHKRRPFTQPLNKWQTKHFAKDLTNLFPDSRAPSLASEARSKSRPFPPQTESAAKPEAAAGSIEATSFNHARVLHLNPASPSTPDHSPQSPSPTAASPGGEPASRDAYCARPASTPQSLLRQPRRRFNEDTPSPRTPPSGVFAPVAITPSPLRVSCDGSPVKITQIETPRALLSPAESFDATPPPRQFTSNHTFAEVPFEAAQKLDEVFTNLLTGRVGHWGARDEIDATLTACGGVGKFDLTPWLRLASIDFSRFVRASLKGKAHAACDELADHDDRSIVTPGGASVDTTDTTLEQPTCRGFDFFSATAAGSPIAKTLARSSLRLSDRRGVEPVHVSLLAVDEASSSESEGTQVPDACYCDELEGEGVCEHCWALEHDRRTLPDENGSAFDSNEADDEEGEEVEVLSQRGHWYQVECARGVYFYNGKSCVSQWEPEGTPFESARGNDRSRAFPTTDDREPSEEIEEVRERNVAPVVTGSRRSRVFSGSERSEFEEWERRCSIDLDPVTLLTGAVEDEVEESSPAAATKCKRRDPAYERARKKEQKKRKRQQEKEAASRSRSATVEVVQTEEVSDTPARSESAVDNVPEDCATGEQAETEATLQSTPEDPTAGTADGVTAEQTATEITPQATPEDSTAEATAVRPTEPAEGRTLCTPPAPQQNGNDSSSPVEDSPLPGQNAEADMASEVDVEAEGLAGDSCEGAGKKKKKKKRNLEYELRRKQKQKIMRKAKLGVDRLEDELLKLNADIEALNRTASGSPIPTLRTDRGSPVAADKELTVRRM